MLKITILGCGPSTGVPTATGNWGACDPSNPKNYRSRSSLFVVSESHNLLIDTTPDLRRQMIDNKIKNISSVLYTHEHADHTHGIDDLREFATKQQATIPVYADQDCYNLLTKRFSYIFNGKGSYPPIATINLIKGVFQLGDMNITPFEQQHGGSTSMGFRINNFAYSTDVSELNDYAFSVLQGIDLWIVDSLRLIPHPSHAHLDKVLHWVSLIRPKRTIITHMNIDMDYDSLLPLLPPGVEPAYDGQSIDL